MPLDEPHSHKPGVGLIARSCPPAANSYEGPNRLDYSEGPCALQEPVDRTEGARPGERENEPWATVFQLIEDKHRGHGE